MLKEGKKFTIPIGTENYRGWEGHWTVKKVYKFTVLCHRENGDVRSFSTGDMVALGVVRQPEELEALRRMK